MPKHVPKKSKHYIWVYFAYLKEEKDIVESYISRQMYIEPTKPNFNMIGSYLNWSWFFACENLNMKLRIEIILYK